MRDLGLDVSVLGIARHYKDIIDALIIDEIDRHLLPEILALGLQAMALPTIMKSDDDRIALARSVVKAGLQWASDPDPLQAAEFGKTRLAAVLTEQEAQPCVPACWRKPSRSPPALHPHRRHLGSGGRRHLPSHHAQVFAEPPRADLNTALAAGLSGFLAARCRSRASDRSAAADIRHDPACLRRGRSHDHRSGSASERHKSDVAAATVRSKLRFCYGIDSFGPPPRRSAAAWSFHVVFVCSRMLAFDLDTPDDLAELNHRRSHAEMAHDDGRFSGAWATTPQINTAVIACSNYEA